MTSEEIKSVLINQGLHEDSVERMLEHYKQLRFYAGTGKWEEAGLYVGKFCESAGNIVLDILGGEIQDRPQLGSILNEIEKINNDADIDDMIRITIPRNLRAAYEIRNKRDTAHVNLELEVNQMDGKNAVQICSWILAEFIRIYISDRDMEEASSIIKELLTTTSPYIDSYNGKRMIMSTDLSVSEEILVHLYNTPGELEVEELIDWIPQGDSNHIRTCLRQLQDDRKIFYDGEKTKITPLGIEVAEDIVNVDILQEEE